MTIVLIAVLWCVGIWTAITIGVAPALWTYSVVLAAVLALLLRDRRRLLIAAIYLTVFCAGGLRAGIAFTHVNVNQNTNYGNDPEVTLIGIVADQPRVRDTRVDVTLQVESVYGAGKAGQPMQGRVLLQTTRYPVWQYGERIRATGALVEVENWSEFDYREYLARQNIFNVMSNAQIVRLDQAAGNPFYQDIYALRARAQSTVLALLPNPQSSLLSGILLGNDSGMPSALRDEFRATGMSHIIAISGQKTATIVCYHGIMRQ